MGQKIVHRLATQTKRATAAKAGAKKDRAIELYRWANIIVPPALIFLITLVSVLDRDTYISSMAEDHWVNWLTFLFWFLAFLGFILKGSVAWQFSSNLKFIFFALSVFCLFVGLEEINWGQRATGLKSPEIISSKIGHSELSVHFILTGLVGVSFERLGAIILALYGFALPLAVSARPQLRRRIGPYISCIPTPIVLPWFLIAGTIMATEIPGLSHEIGELLFSLSFLFFSACPPIVSNEFPSPTKGTAIAGVLAALLLFVPSYKEDTVLKNKKQIELAERYLSEVLANGIQDEILQATRRAIATDPKIANKLEIFHKIIRQKNIPLLIAISELTVEGKKLNINQSDSNGKSPLILAIEEKDPEIVELLLHLNADPDTSDKNGNSALHLAISSKEPRLVEALLARNPNIEDRDQDGLTPIMLAAKLDLLLVVEKLIQRGASLVETDFTGRNVIELAPPESKSALLLADAITDPNPRTIGQTKPLFPARIEFIGNITSVWDSKDPSLLLFVSVTINNAGEQQANDVKVELYEHENLVSLLEGQDFLLPATATRFTASVKTNISDRQGLVVRTSCGNCLPENSEKSATNQTTKQPPSEDVSPEPAKTSRKGS